MIASLPMYDSATTRAANDRFWRAIRTLYGRGPHRLDRSSDPHDTWSQPDLVLSQTCGLPYRSSLHDKVQLIGTPDYALPDCAPGYYMSHIVVRADDGRADLTEFASGRIARNDHRSQSGWAALTAHLAENRIALPNTAKITDTGSHAASVQAVADGQADMAAIDAVTWQFLARDTTSTGAVRVLTSTRPTPGLPLISGLRENQSTLFAAIKQALEQLSDEDQACLMIRDLVAIPASDYLAVPLP